MYTLSPSKSIKGSKYGEFLKDKNVFIMYTTVLSLTAPNLESLLTQQYVCVIVHSDLIIHAFLLIFIA
jgi:hypothetical protein